MEIFARVRVLSFKRGLCTVEKVMCEACFTNDIYGANIAILERGLQQTGSKIRELHCILCCYKECSTSLDYYINFHDSNKSIEKVT